MGKDLPRKNHLAIEAEILSALEDMLTERSQKIGKPAWTRQSRPNVGGCVVRCLRSCSL